MEINLLWAGSPPKNSATLQNFRSPDYKNVQLKISNPLLCNELQLSKDRFDFLFDCPSNSAQIRIDKNSLNGMDYVTALRQALSEFSTIEVWGDDDKIKSIYLIGRMAGGLTASREPLNNKIPVVQASKLKPSKVSFSNKEIYEIRALSKDSPFPADLFHNPRYQKILDNAQIQNPADWMDSRKQSKVLRYMDMMQKINKVKR